MPFVICLFLFEIGAVALMLNQTEIICLFIKNLLCFTMFDFCYYGVIFDWIDHMDAWIQSSFIVHQRLNSFTQFEIELTLIFHTVTYVLSKYWNGKFCCKMQIMFWISFCLEVSNSTWSNVNSMSILLENLLERRQQTQNIERTELIKHDFSL